MKYLLTIFYSSIVLSQSISPINQKLQNLSLLAVEHLNELTNESNNNEIKANIDSLNSDLLNISPDLQSKILENSLFNKILSNSVTQKKALNVSTNLIKKIEQKLKDQPDIYTDLSKKIISMIIDDYRPYFEAGFLNRYQSFSRNNAKEVKKYRELLAKLKLTSHWLHLYLNKSAVEFNKMVSDIIFESFELSKDTAYYYANFTKQDETKTLVFSINLKKKEKAFPKKEDNLKDAVKDIEDNVLEKASEEIDSLIPTK